VQNAPYHHVRGVPSLASITTKKHMADLIENTLVKPPIEGVQPVTHLTLPVKTGTRDTALSVPISEITKDIEEGIRAAASKPRVPSGEELKEVWLQAMKNHADQGMRQLLDGAADRAGARRPDQGRRGGGRRGGGRRGGGRAACSRGG